MKWRICVFLFIAIPVILLILIVAHGIHKNDDDSSPWTHAELQDMAEIFYQEYSEQLTAFASAFAETEESQLHIHINSENAFDLTAEALPEQLRQPFVDCFSDALLLENGWLDIDFFNVESFLENPAFDIQTGFPARYFQENLALYESPTSDYEAKLLGMTGIFGKIKISQDNHSAYEVGEQYFYYYSDKDSFVADRGEESLERLLDEHWIIYSDIYPYGGI